MHEETISTESQNTVIDDTAVTNADEVQVSGNDEETENGPKKLLAERKQLKQEVEYWKQMAANKETVDIDVEELNRLIEPKIKETTAKLQHEYAIDRSIDDLGASEFKSDIKTFLKNNPDESVDDAIKYVYSKKDPAKLVKFLDEGTINKIKGDNSLDTGSASPKQVASTSADLQKQLNDMGIR